MGVPVKLKLFSISFTMACLLLISPAYAGTLDDGSNGNDGTVPIVECTASSEATDSSSNATDPIGPCGPSIPKQKETLDPSPSSSKDVKATTPINSAPDTVAGNQAVISNSETITQTVKIEKQDMHRLYNPNSGEHFYTASTYERNYLVGIGWRYEGIGWMAPIKSDYPVYRLYNPNAGDHHYTLSAHERNHLIGIGWNDEGIGWYSAIASEGVAVLRQYNPNAIAGAHNFTTSPLENMTLINAGWKAEGTAWHALASDSKTIESTVSSSTEKAPYLTATFTAANNAVPESVVSYAKGSDTYLFLPSYAPLDKIYLSAHTAKDSASALMLAGSGAYVAVNPNSPLNLLSLGASRDTSGTFRLSFKATTDGTVFPLIVMQSANIPTIYINSNDLDSQGRAYVEASADHSAKASIAVRMIDANGLVVYDKDTPGNNKKLLSTIKGRGNSTWKNGIKKPYQISLSNKADLVSSAGVAKKWILLANSADATLLRSTVAYNLAAELGLATVDVRPIDLYYDGEYRGSYLLTEKVEINPGRVDIYDLEEQIEAANSGVDLEKLPTAQTTNGYGNKIQYVTGVNDPSDISGGYLIELDNGYYTKELCWFEAKWPGDNQIAHFVVKSPEIASQNAIRFLSEAVQQALDNLFQDKLANGKPLVNGQYAFDLDSFAKMYLLEEFLKNNDTYTSSTYFYLDKGSKIIMSGPVWDFDAGMGTRVDARDSIQSTYWGYYLDTHATILSPSVKQRAQEIYTSTLKGLIANVVLGNASAVGPRGKLRSIAFYADDIAASQRMNEIPFGITSFANQAQPFATWKLNVEFFQQWLSWRLKWVNANLNGMGNMALMGPNTNTRWYDNFDYGLIFDYQYYLDQNPDLRANGIVTDAQALQHFVEYGIHEDSRIGKTSRNFNVKAYMDKNPNLKQKFGNNLMAYYMHYCMEGFVKGLACW